MDQYQNYIANPDWNIPTDTTEFNIHYENKERF